AYGECLRIYPDDPEVLRRLAELLFLNGDRNAAEPLYRRYLHIDSTDAFAWCRIGEIQAGQGKKKKAAATWKSIIAEVPNHPLAYRLLDVLMAEEKSIEERIALWDTLSEKYPEAAEPLVRRALLYDAAAEEEALLLLRRAVVLVPGDSVIHYHLGIAAYHQGMFEESAAAFREALRLNPSDPRNVRWLEKVLAEKT
ncbi:MAG: tetratricopeptide repeat protein, partial [Candidatus Hydrogenedentes bacterium]|nr:tetratricopeptide repeat protein [Candidatus Hydrogenedentota bacterium]